LSIVSAISLRTGLSNENIGENMPKQSGWVKISGYLFLLGVVVAVVAGLVNIPQSSTILLVLGVIIGLLGALGVGSVDPKEADMFLLAVIALMAAGAAGHLGDLPIVGQYLGPIVSNIALLVAPAAVIIALEAVWRAGSIKF